MSDVDNYIALQLEDRATPGRRKPMSIGTGLAVVGVPLMLFVIFAGLYAVGGWVLIAVTVGIATLIGLASQTGDRKLNPGPAVPTRSEARDQPGARPTSPDTSE